MHMSLSGMYLVLTWFDVFGDIKVTLTVEKIHFVWVSLFQTGEGNAKKLPHGEREALS